MKTTQELYDIDPKVLAEMNYKDALEYKFAKAKDKLNALFYSKPIAKFTDVDTKTNNDLVEAIAFNKFLLNELNA